MAILEVARQAIQQIDWEVAWAQQNQTVVEMEAERRATWEQEQEQAALLLGDREWAAWETERERAAWVALRGGERERAWVGAAIRSVRVAVERQFPELGQRVDLFGAVERVQKIGQAQMEFQMFRTEARRFPMAQAKRHREQVQPGRSTWDRRMT